jgi:hypothetical protein
MWYLPPSAACFQNLDELGVTQFTAEDLEVGGMDLLDSWRSTLTLKARILDRTDWPEKGSIYKRGLHLCVDVWRECESGRVENLGENVTRIEKVIGASNKYLIKINLK